MFLEYTLKDKNKIVKLIEFLQPLVPEESLDKILDFYNYYDASFYTIEDNAVAFEFISQLKKLAKESSIELPEEFKD